MRSYLPRLTHIFYVGTHKHKLHSFTLCDANTHSHTLTVFTLSLPLISSFSLFWAKTYIYLQASSYKNHSLSPSLSHTHTFQLSLSISLTVLSQFQKMSPTANVCMVDSKKDRHAGDFILFCSTISGLK